MNQMNYRRRQVQPNQSSKCKKFTQVVLILIIIGILSLIALKISTGPKTPQQSKLFQKIPKHTKGHQQWFKTYQNYLKSQKIATRLIKFNNTFLDLGFRLTTPSDPETVLKILKQGSPFPTPKKKEFSLDFKNSQFENFSQKRKDEAKNIFQNYLKHPYSIEESMQFVKDQNYTSMVANLTKDLTKVNFTLHAICHSHQDLGWLDTYYNYSVKRDNKILTNIVTELNKDFRRKFVLGNTGYLKLWLESPDSVGLRDELKKLLAEGRIEMSNSGSVTSHDEAASYYNDILVNVRAGVKWWKNEFKETDKDLDLLTKASSWMIDSFGHSLSSVRLQREMGMKNMVTNRIDYTEKRGRAFENKLMFKWIYESPEDEETKDNFEDEMLTSVAFQHYSFPITFKNWDLGTINPMNITFNNETAPSFKNFVQDINYLADMYKDRHVMGMFGDDMRYFDSESIYRQIEFCMIFLASQNKTTFKNVEMNYSTTKEYFDTIRKIYREKKEEFDVKKNTDFFPYTNRISAYFETGGTWTGYFTTRPWHKHFFQEFGRVLRNFKLLISKNYLKKEKIDEKLKFKLSEAEWWTGVVTHHDAITSVARQAVMDDYVLNLNKNYDQLISNLQDYFKKRYTFCREKEEYGVGACMIPVDQKITDIAIVDPKNKNSEKDAEFVVNLDLENFFKYELTDPKSGDQMEFTTECMAQWDDCKQIFYIPKEKLTNYFSEFKLKKTLDKPEPDFYQFFRTKKFKLTDEKGKEIFYIVEPNKERDGVRLIELETNSRFEIKWVLYKGITTDDYNKGYGNEDGPYILGLKNQEKIDLVTINLRFIELKNYYRVLSDVLEMEFGSIEIRIPKRINSENPTINFEVFHHINELVNVPDGVNVDLMVNYKTEILNNLEFKTDSNGLDTVQRKYSSEAKFRETPYKRELNHYPVNRFIMASERIPYDNKENGSVFSRTVGVFVDRPSSGTVSPESEVELNLQRRSFFDDRKGMWEPVFEKKKILKKHVLVFGEEKDVERELRRLVIQKENEPFLLANFYVEDFIEQKEMRVNLSENEEKIDVDFESAFGDLKLENCQVDVEFDLNKIGTGEKGIFLTLINMNDDMSLEVDDLEERISKFFGGELGVGEGGVEEFMINFYKRKEGEQMEGSVGLKPLEIKVLWVSIKAE